MQFAAPIYYCTESEGVVEVSVDRKADEGERRRQDQEEERYMSLERSTTTGCLVEPEADEEEAPEEDVDTDVEAGGSADEGVRDGAMADDDSESETEEPLLDFSYFEQVNGDPARGLPTQHRNFAVAPLTSTCEPARGVVLAKDEFFESFGLR